MRLLLLMILTGMYLFIICRQDVIAESNNPSIQRIHTILRDSRGRTLTNAFCVVYPSYGLPLSLRANSRGEAFLEGDSGAVLRCVRQKQAFEAKIPTGEPSQLLMRPLGGGDCFVYNALPVDSAYSACKSEKSCEWSGFGPYGACSEMPKKE